MLANELFEYMATGKPIIYAGIGAAAELLREIGCVVTVTPEDPAAMITAITELLRDPKRMRVLGDGKVSCTVACPQGKVDGKAGFSAERALR